ncbi:MAG TPA: hypothetical protein VG759_25770 [Candidatus Angelobacter sp.]|jgi:hypothetical protein|nr:hypothetical protein [Candidatus Angelobacter sp.]
MSNQDNRVLIRKGARVLSEAEVQRVKGSGGPQTQTACTFPGRTMSAVDGDPGECGPL